MPRASPVRAASPRETATESVYTFAGANRKFPMIPQYSQNSLFLDSALGEDLLSCEFRESLKGLDKTSLTTEITECTEKIRKEAACARGFGGEQLWARG